MGYSKSSAQWEIYNSKRLHLKRRSQINILFHLRKLETNVTKFKATEIKEIKVRVKLMK